MSDITKLQITFITEGDGVDGDVYHPEERVLLIDDIKYIPQIDSMIRFNNEQESFTSTRLYRDLFIDFGESDYCMDFIFRVKNIYYEYLPNLVKVVIFAELHNEDLVFGDSAREIDAGKLRK